MSFFSEASLAMIPSGYKTSKVYSALPITGDGDLTFTRSNDTATRVGPDGLIEKVRTNVALYSEQFDNAYWTKSQATITANATTAPDGTLTAEKLIEGSGSVTPECARTPIATSNSIFTLSVFAKASERNFLIINNNDGTGSYRVWFNLTTGVIGTTDAGVTAFIENVGNGWFRCGVARQITAFASATSAFQIGSADGVQTYTGDGTSGIFIWGAQMELSDFGPTDYIATTTAAVSVGPVANVPRLDYLDSSSPRLNLEPQRSNLYTFSEQTDNAAWGKTNASITANNTASPDGYTNADKVIADTTNGVHRIEQDKATAAQVATQSAFAKASGYNFIALENGGEIAYFNISTGVVGSVSGGTASIQDYGNGWYRCIFSATALNTKSYIYICSADNVITFAGDNTSGAFIYGAQIEAGDYATSYIPTLGASVTRGVDAASKTGISSLIGQTEGAFMIDVNLDSRASFTYFALASDLALASNYLGIGLNASSIVFESVNGSVLQAGITLSNSATGRFKIAVAYKANDFVMYVNGTQAGTDTSGSVPTCSQIGLYQYDQTPSVKYNQILLFPTRLSNDDLAALTA